MEQCIVFNVWCKAVDFFIMSGLVRLKRFLAAWPIVAQIDINPKYAYFHVLTTQGVFLSADFPWIFDPPEISTNLGRK